MARIKGVDIPNEKRVEIALTYIYGIGRKSDKKTGVGEIFWEDGSGEKRNRCESCANSSPYFESKS